MLEESGLLAKGTRETVKNGTKEQKGRFPPVLLGTLAASLWGSAIIGRGVLRSGKEAIRAGDLRLPHSLTNFEIKKYYQNEPNFNSVYSGNNLSETKNGNIINVDEYELVGTHWIALHVNANNVIHFGSFGVEHFQKKNKRN